MVTSVMRLLHLKQCTSLWGRWARLSAVVLLCKPIFLPITAFVLLFKAMAVALAAQITAAALLVVAAVVEWNQK